MFIRSSNLQEICFNVIVYNLESIVNNTRIPQRSTDFLLRRYAAKLYHEYNKIEKDIKEDIMLWFLNPFAKEITLPRELYSEKIINKLQFVGMGITSLNLNESDAPENELNTIIRSVPCVQILNLSFTYCTDETLSVIHEVCPYLENLDLSFCESVTDVGMENLCGGNLSLKILDLTDSGVLDEGVGIILSKMPSLECIKASGVHIGYLMDLHDTPQIYNLTEFEYGETRGYSFKVLAIQKLTKRCPKIKKLYFDFEVEEKLLRACREFQELEVLKFNMSRHWETNLYPILPISQNLKILMLSCMEVPIVMLVENFKNLEKLYLSFVSFTDFKEKDITCTENKLDTLVIKGMDRIGLEVSGVIHEALVLLLSLSKNVRNLALQRLDNVPCDVYGIILKSMKNLSSVNFKDTPVDINYLIPFFDIPSLKMIYVDTYEYSLFKNLVEKRKFLPKSSSTLSWRHSHRYDFEDVFII